jgi:hypothetical protein
MTMSMGWDYVSELRKLTCLLFTPQVIYDYGEPMLQWSTGEKKTDSSTCYGNPTSEVI